MATARNPILWVLASLAAATVAAGLQWTWLTPSVAIFSWPIHGLAAGAAIIASITIFIFAMRSSPRWGWLSLLAAPLALWIPLAAGAATVACWASQGGQFQQALLGCPGLMIGAIASSGEAWAVKANLIANEIREGNGGQWDKRVAIAESVMPHGEELAAVNELLARWEFEKLDDDLRPNWLGTDFRPDQHVYVSRVYSEFPCSVVFVVVADFDVSSRLIGAEGFVPPGACL